MTSTPAEPATIARVPTITALTGIRALAATWVVIEHFRFELFGLFPGAERWLAPWVESGYLGVEIFFVLSGFIISYNYAGRLRSFDPTAARAFWVNRFARIYPLHLVTLLVVAFLVAAASVTNTELNSSGNYTPVSFVGNVFLLQSLPGIQAWNGPAWSISAEAAAYLAFPAIALALTRLQTRSAATLAAVWLVVGTAAMVAVTRAFDASSFGTPMIALRITTEFVAGCLLWKAWSSAGSHRSPRWDGVAIVVLMLVLVGLGFFGDVSGWAFVLTPALALFVLACGASTEVVNRVLSSSALRWGGEISYSLYMVHFLVLIVVGKLLPWESFAGSALPVRVAVMAVYYATCVLVAWASYRLIEMPGKRLVHHLLDRERQGRAVRAGQ